MLFIEINYETQLLFILVLVREPPHWFRVSENSKQWPLKGEIELRSILSEIFHIVDY